jgi:hypothetical protein
MLKFQKRVYSVKRIYTTTPCTKLRSGTGRQNRARCARRATTRSAPRASYSRLHNLAQRVEDNVNQRIERSIQVLFLHLSTRQRRLNARIGHVRQVVSNDRIDGLTGCAYNGLNNIPEVVDDEVERCAALGNGPEEAVYRAYYGVDLSSCQFKSTSSFWERGRTYHLRHIIE